MARGPCTFRQGDVTRAVKGAVAAGLQVQRVEIDKTGKIAIVAPEPEGEADRSATSWDEALNRDEQ